MEICECCLFLLVNGDESGCRDYYNHFHAPGDFSGPGTAVVEDSEGVEIAAHWTCGACHTDMLPFTRMFTVTHI